MWIVIEGEAGSGKTWFQTKLVRREWQNGEKIYSNYDLTFSPKNEDIHRFYSLDETYRLERGILSFDELQDLAGYWQSMPISFRNKIAHHRHHLLTVYSNTQAFRDLHTELRRNVHIRYRCRSVLRFPFNDAKLPIFQWIQINKKTKVAINANDEPKFKAVGRTKNFFLSKYWTRSYYNTHANIDFNRFVCKLIYKRKNNERGCWILKVIDRDLISQGKKRL